MELLAAVLSHATPGLRTFPMVRLRRVDGDEGGGVTPADLELNLPTLASPPKSRPPVADGKNDVSPEVTIRRQVLIANHTLQLYG